MAFTVHWVDGRLRSAASLASTLQFSFIMVGVLPILASNILAGAFDRIFFISREASSPSSVYFRRIKDDEGRIHRRGDLSLLPAASRFGRVE